VRSKSKKPVSDSEDTFENDLPPKDPTDAKAKSCKGSPRNQSKKSNQSKPSNALSKLPATQFSKKKLDRIIIDID
jgi:hypothetical protein